MNVTDPVCGMSIEKSDAEASETYKGKEYYFCAANCHDKFLNDPESFIVKTEITDDSCEVCDIGTAPAAKVLSKETYTCPMHPEIKQKGPGSCPKCGIALEPKTISAEKEENPELINMTRRFKISAILNNTYS